MLGGLARFLVNLVNQTGREGRRVRFSFATLIWLVLAAAMVLALVSLLRFYSFPAITNPDPVSIPLIIVLTGGTIVANVAVAYFLLGGAQWTRSLGPLYLIVTASLAANYTTPGKAGIPLRVFLYNRILGIAPGTGSAVVSLEALLGILVPSLLGAFAVTLVLPGRNFVASLVAVLAAALAISIIILLRSPQYGWLFGRMPLPRFVRRILTPEGNFILGFRAIGGQSLATVMLLYVLIFVVAGSRLFLVFDLFDTSLPLVELVGISAIAFILGSLSFIPMGLGVRDATLVALFVQAGADRDVAISVAALDRILTTGVPLLLGLISMQMLGFQALRKENMLAEKRGSEGPL